MKTIMVDIVRCNGCFNCQIACKDEHVDNDWSPIAKPQPDTGHFWMLLTEIERGQYPKVKIAYIATPCMQCENAPCLEAAQNGAAYQRKDGILIIDPVKSKGQKQLVDSCPYGRIYWNEELKIPQKCTFCAHLLDQGYKEPRCVEACPTEALVWGEYDELLKKAEGKGKKVEVLKPELGLKPAVLYTGLPKRFVAGTVLFGDINECAENLEVTLTGDGTKKTTTTNNYGDFEFEGLPADQKFSIKVEYTGYAPQSFKTLTKKDVYLGEIRLERNNKL